MIESLSKEVRPSLDSSGRHWPALALGDVSVFRNFKPQMDA